MAEMVVLVDENDRELGSEEKIKAHREGKLHRAFSILIFNSEGKMLLQKRAKSKYHSGGLWTNACCSHPGPGELLEESAHRRLRQEMGFDCGLKELFSFAYRVKLGENLFENEYDHIFIGIFDGKPKPDKNEADEWKWISTENLKEDISNNPQDYSRWFLMIMERIIE